MDLDYNGMFFTRQHPGFRRSELESTVSFYPNVLLCVLFDLLDYCLSDMWKPVKTFYYFYSTMQ